MKAIDMENNPEYREIRRKKDKEIQERAEKIKSIETPIIEDFRKNNLTEIDSLDDLLKQKIITPQYTDVILKWITQVSNDYNVQEILVRSLAISDKPFEGAALIELFDKKESSVNLKWAIGNSIASAKVLGIEKWLENKLSNDTYTKENEMLVYAAEKYLGEEKGKKIVREIFNTYPLQAGDVLSRIGNEKDLEFLKLKSENYSNEIKQQLKKYINKLQKKIFRQT